MKAFEPGAIVVISMDGVAKAMQECKDEIDRLNRLVSLLSIQVSPETMRIAEKYTEKYWHDSTYWPDWPYWRG